MESKEYFEKVMQDYNQNRKGRSLRKYCKDEAVDYDWLIQYKKNYPLQEKQQEPSQDAFIPITIKDETPKPTTWQVEKLVLKSPDGEQIEIKSNNPRNYNEAFVFYSKDYRKVKILHYDINGWVLCSKWFTDGKFLKPEFEECKITHELSRETLILIMSTSVQTKIRI